MSSVMSSAVLYCSENNVVFLKRSTGPLATCDYFPFFVAMVSHMRMCAHLRFKVHIGSATL